jgi:transcriptional regulator with XRE-family HTH domain
MVTKPPEIRGILSKNVKEQRKRLGFTLEKLAELTGLAVQTINDIEGGRRWVSDNTITKLSKALRIESYQLLIADFFSQSRKKDTPTQHFINLKEKILKNVDSQIETQFNDFLKSGLLPTGAGYDKTPKLAAQREAEEETLTPKAIKNTPGRGR